MTTYHQCFFAACVVASATAIAQTGEAKVTQYVPQADVKAIPTEAIGWDYSLTLSANLALAQNANIVGQPEGTSFLIGLGAVGSIMYLDGPHDFRTSLTVVESFSKTPILDRLVKANDLARIESIYSYYFLDWLGAFARLSAEAPLLNTEDVRSSPVDYSITRLDGTTQTESQLQARNLANGLQPLTLTQSIGLAARPYSSAPATINIRLGGGARETFAKGVLINKDDKTTTAVELVETDTVLQGGAEFAAGISGAISEMRLAYGVDFGLLIPFLNNDAQKRSAIDLMRIGVAGSLSFSMFEWLGLKYQLLVQQDPQLIAGLQVQNNIFVTFKYDIIPAKPMPAKADPLKEAEAARAAAEARAMAAETRAFEAEAKVQQLRLDAPKLPSQTP